MDCEFCGAHFSHINNLYKHKRTNKACTKIREKQREINELKQQLQKEKDKNKKLKDAVHGLMDERVSLQKDNKQKQEIIYNLTKK